jgi:tellurite resistance protein TerC
MAHLELWVAFWVVVVGVLAVDLFLFNRKAHQVSMKEASLWSIAWITLAMLFCGGIYIKDGSNLALQFLTGYLVELSLSVDNLFVFLLIFGYFAVEPRYQHRVLFWGVIGAIVMRFVMIFAGVALVQRFHWILYLFGAFLLFTGIKLAFKGDEESDPAQNPAVKLVRRFLPVTDTMNGEKFFTRLNGKWVATPLFLVLVTVEFSDLVFALDSIPAIFGITQDGFVILTSNIFAIMGLRSMFFLLSGFMDRFHYLQMGLALVLSFIGVKMLVADFYHIGTGTSLSIVGAVLSLSVIASLLRKPEAS